MSKLRGLGTNFENLVPVGINVDVVTAASEHKIHSLPIDVIKPKNNQPRQFFDEKELSKLAHSISVQGILQPIIVTENEQNMYTIIAGERRWRAASLAGLNEVPAIIKDVNELEHLQLAVLENVQRQDLSALEFAQSIKRLHDEFQLSYEEIANNLGKAYTTVVNLVRLLNLPTVMQESLANGTISEGHGRALLALAKLPEYQNKLYIEIISKGLSVRQAEAAAANYKQGKDFKPQRKNPAEKHAALVDTGLIAKKLGVKKVEIKPAKSGGRLILSYKTDEDLKRISQFLLK